MKKITLALLLAVGLLSLGVTSCRKENTLFSEFATQLFEGDWYLSKADANSYKMLFSRKELSVYSLVYGNKEERFISHSGRMKISFGANQKIYMLGTEGGESTRLEFSYRMVLITELNLFNEKGAQFRLAIVRDGQGLEFKHVGY